MRILGVDPGQSGGLAVLDESGQCVYTAPMPLAGKDVDFGDIARQVRCLEVTAAICEKAQAMSKKGVQGVTGAFKFGVNYGGLLGLFAALQVPLRVVTPQAWKKVILVGTSKDKDAAISYCRRAWPSESLLATPRSRVPHDGLADALCIAEYGRRTWSNTVT